MNKFPFPKDDDTVNLLPELPDFNDLSARLKFSPKTGRIWLDDQRMMLLHGGSLGALRNELIETLGVDMARALLTRMGYTSGAYDAELAAKIRPTQDFFDVFSVGPQLHSLEGVTSVEPVRLEADVAKGTYYGEFIWHDSIEDEIHINKYGLGADPVCWMQIGYACGYTSVFMGRPIFYREVECRATGYSACRIIGKPQEEWGPEIEDELMYLQPQSFTKISTSHASQTALKKAAAMPDLNLKDTKKSAESPFREGVSTNMVGASTAFNIACHMLDKVSLTDATVLFQGESGVGKEMFAKTLHQIGKRAENPFIAVNCAALPENLVEAELFGVEKGAFTGAIETRPGRFERADTGTIFLDEIATLSLSAQGKLLRVLQEQELERVGGKKVHHIDCRVIAATNEDLRTAVQKGAFREDLYYRLNVFPIHIPPLRERKADIPLLMNHFLSKFCARYDKDVTGYTSRAIDGFIQYHWPGNIRELENIVERGVILAPHGGAIDLSHLFTFGETVQNPMLGIGHDGLLNAALTSNSTETPVPTNGNLVDHVLEGSISLADFESELLEKAVEKSGGNLSAAARMLGITRPQLAYRLSKKA